MEDNMMKIVFVKSVENQANPYTKTLEEESFKKNADMYEEYDFLQSFSTLGG